MSRFTTQQVMVYSETEDKIALLTNAPPGSTLLIESYSGIGWVWCNEITVSGIKELFVRGRTVRYTPLGGMIYKVSEAK